MATIVTRAGKGAALSFAEGDANFTNLNTDKLENIANESIGDLNDVDLTGIEDGQILIFDGVQNKFVAGEGLASNSGSQVDDTNIALTDLSAQSSGDGSLTYDNETGTFTYVGPGVADYRAAFSAGANISITNGEIAVDGTFGIALTDLSVTVAAPGEISDLSYNNSTGAFTFTPVDTTDLLGSVVQDTAPSLGGNLDVNGRAITSSAGGNVEISADGKGRVLVDGFTYPKFELLQESGSVLEIVEQDGQSFVRLDNNFTLYNDGSQIVFTGTDVASIGLDENQVYFIFVANEDDSDLYRLREDKDDEETVVLNIVSPITDCGWTVTFNDIPIDAVLTWDGQDLTLASPTGITGLFEDFDPQLASDLDVNDFGIVNTAGDGDGKVVITGLAYPNIDGTNGQLLTTDGQGILSFTTFDSSIIIDDIASSTTTTFSSTKIDSVLGDISSALATIQGV